MEKDLKLAIIGGRASLICGKLYTHVSFGKIVEAFAKRYRKIIISSPLNNITSYEDDYQLPDNVKLSPQPNWKTTIDSIQHLSKIRKSYKNAIIEADHVFIRGNPVAATKYLYECCAANRKPVCHWLVGNPMVLLKSHKRDNIIKDLLGRIYIWQWEKKLLHGQRITNGSFLCNGREIAKRYATSKTVTIVSTTLTKDDIYKRHDTCEDRVITLLCLCYIRPEKGIEYLIIALQQLKIDRPICLIIAGSRSRYEDYQKRLDDLVKKNGLEEKIKWLGHVRYKEIHNLMIRADIFVLPTLSEGTPRVLVEARAKGLPVVSTNVGGIPTSIENGHDGIIVPPKNPEALKEAISNIIEDGELRRKLIHNGYKTVMGMTVDKFVKTAIRCFYD